MVGSGRTVGIILVALSIIAFLATSGLMAAQYIGGDTSIGGAALGTALVTFFISLPLLAAGVWFFTRGRQEASEFAEVEKQKKLLNVIVTQGQLSVADMSLELDASRDQVKAWIYDLVGKGLFSGYVNWEDGMLYSKQASQMREARVCPTCGAELELAGKGVITCPYCGVDIFLAT
jgi:ribosomal protein S27AE